MTYIFLPALRRLFDADVSEEDKRNEPNVFYEGYDG
jgi:hypothetical protein